MKRMLALTVVLAMALVGAGIAGADVIQFAYVNSNPGNVSTLISVINRASASEAGCDTGDKLRLHYIYMTKSVDAAHTDACDELDFDRPTTENDIVTFDFAGNIGGGLALFNDATSYNAGVGNPNFDMPTLGTSEPRRGYVLVNHRCLAGGDEPTYNDDTLHGEAMLFDVVNGAAWNYTASESRYWGEIDDYAFTSTYYYAQGTWGASIDILDEGRNTDDPVALFPFTEMTTRFLVTPQVIASNVNITADMSDVSGPGQKRTIIDLKSRSGQLGMFDRNENTVSGGGPVHVRCVAGIDVSELLGLAATTINDEGGFAYIDLDDPPALKGVDTSIDSDYNHGAIVFKLEFGAPTWSGGGMVNAARLIREELTIQDAWDACCGGG